MAVFIVLARPTPPDGAHYLLTEVEVVAKNWKEAYEKVRTEESLPFIDEYIPSPSRR